MNRRKFLIVASSALAASSLTSFSTAASPAPQNGLSLSVQTPDGSQWILGERGVGRPFMARLLLSNVSGNEIKIWDPQNSEGALCPSVALIDEAGKETVLTPPPIARAAGVPTVWKIQPHGIVAINMELLRLVGQQTLPAGKYKLLARYENREPEAGGFVKGVWTGKVESEPVAIEIVRPK